MHRARLYCGVVLQRRRTEGRGRTQRALPELLRETHRTARQRLEIRMPQRVGEAAPEGGEEKTQLDTATPDPCDRLARDAVLRSALYRHRLRAQRRNIAACPDRKVCNLLRDRLGPWQYRSRAAAKTRRTY